MGIEERIKPLHNFTMPNDLRWGNTRHLRCIKITPHMFLNRNDDKEISAVRQKLISDLHTAADDIKQVVSSLPHRPWNLRTRRGADEYLKFDCMETVEKSNGDDGGKRDKFSVALSKKEMEEDFAVLGQRIHRRPKKRLRVVQKQLDTLFPGLWLKEVTSDMYKVVEAAP